MLLIQLLSFLYLGDILISFHDMIFLFHNVIGDGYCFYRSILQDSSLKQQFQENFHAIRSHVVYCVRTHELRYTLIEYLFHIENTSFFEWSNRMQTSTQVLPYGCWTRAIDLFLLVLVLKRDIVVLSNCPRTKCLVSKSYFDELNKIKNGSYRRTSCYPCFPLELAGPPIYVLFHAQGDLNSSDVYAFNHYGYLKQVNGQITTSLTNPCHVTTIITSCVSPTSSSKELQHHMYTKRRRILQKQKSRKRQYSTESGQRKQRKKLRDQKARRAYVSSHTSVDVKTKNKKRHHLVTHNNNEVRKECCSFQHPRLGKKYNKDLVHQYWKECIQHGVQFNDPQKAITLVDYKNKMNALRNSINNMKKKKNIFGLARLGGFDKLCFSKQKLFAELYEFERQTMSLHHRQCSRCKRVTLLHETDIKSKKWRKKQGYSNVYQCNLCNGNDSFKKDLDLILPIWYNDNNEPQYHLPDELQNLTVSEQLLIQRLSGYVPLVHIKNGTFGIKGSCCAFRQDISDVCTSLPRKRVEMVKYIRALSKESKELINVRVLQVRKIKVMKALYWLKKYHVEYRNDSSLVIDESNLDWMGDEKEAQIANCPEVWNSDDEIASNDKPSKEVDEKIECSISQLQRTSLEGDEEENNGMEYIGALGDNESSMNNPYARKQIEDLRKTYEKNSPKSKRDEMLPWPSVSKEPENEFYGMKIFVNMFPWLFPGGVGDINECKISERKLQFKVWADFLLHFWDGRFAKDPIWCFYTENMRQRRENMASGSFFVKDFVKSNAPETIDDLKRMIQHGNTSFLEKLQYYSHKSHGSDAYWRRQRYEVESWINYHVQNGNGPPTIFLTLSCAEYYWPDLIRLLEERIRMETNDGSCPNLRENKTALHKAVNNYSVVVQEYFHKRVQIWLNTIGKKIFGIKHYWYRHEFAKGRGQIHSHMLCILDNQHVMSEAYRNIDNKQKRTKVLADYMRSTFDLSANHPGVDNNGNIDLTQVGHPEGLAKEQKYKDQATGKYLWEVDNHDKDLCQLVNSCMMHECNKFCLRKMKKKNAYYCRMNGGELNTETNQTPGFQLQDIDTLTVDSNGIKRLALQRNSKRMNQSSFTALRSWRANCDVQLIIYDSDPEYPNLDEIAKISDYVVSYTCKGNLRKQTEKGMMKEIVHK